MGSTISLKISNTDFLLVTPKVRFLLTKLFVFLLVAISVSLDQVTEISGDWYFINLTFILGITGPGVMRAEL